MHEHLSSTFARSTSNSASGALALAEAPSASLDTLAAYLTDGYWEDDGGAGRRFSTSWDNTISVDLTRLTAEGKQLARWAMDAWELVADIRFAEISGYADIEFDDDDAGAYSDSWVYGSTIEYSIINVSTTWLDKDGTSIDSYSYKVYMHEIGHALGLGHQGDYNGSATFGVDNHFANDSWQLSVMSYFSQDENPNTTASYALQMTPMMADILAIQSLYGASSATAGDTLWGQGTDLPGVLGNLFGSRSHYSGEDVAFTIYDQGGIDTLDLSILDTNDRIDLRDGHFSDAGGLVGNIGIMRGTVVENAITGGGGNRITGNDADNLILSGRGADRLHGGTGDDTLNGEKGDDALRGGSGNDRLIGENGEDWLLGGNGNDWLGGGSGEDKLTGGDGDDHLRGHRDDDTLRGGAGRDLLSGDFGNDQLFGGRGADRFVFATGHGRDVVHDFSRGKGQETLHFDGLDGLDSFETVLAAARDTPAGVRINTGAGSSLLLKDIALDSLTADDFLF